MIEPSISAGCSIGRSIGSSRPWRRLAPGALILIVAGLGVFVAFKLWRRRRFFKELGRARISVEELRRLMDVV